MFLLGLWCFLFVVFPVYSQVSPLERLVSLNCDNCTVREALDTLSKQAQCYFTFSSQLFDVHRQAKFNLHN